MAATTGHSPPKARKGRTAVTVRPLNTDYRSQIDSTAAARLQFLATLCGLDNVRGELVASLFWGEVPS